MENRGALRCSFPGIHQQHTWFSPEGRVHKIPGALSLSDLWMGLPHRPFWAPLRTLYCGDSWALFSVIRSCPDDELPGLCGQIILGKRAQEFKPWPLTVSWIWYYCREVQVWWKDQKKHRISGLVWDKVVVNSCAALFASSVSSIYWLHGSAVLSVLALEPGLQWQCWDLTIFIMPASDFAVRCVWWRSTSCLSNTVLLNAVWESLFQGILTC